MEDYRQRTVLAGLSNLGGVFTVIDGVFAMIFGATLITIIFGEFSYEKSTTLVITLCIPGSKPISPFGILGLAVRQKLKGAIQERYPLLKEEIRQGGMASFIKDVAVESNMLGDTPVDKDILLQDYSRLPGL